MNKLSCVKFPRDTRVGSGPVVKSTGRAGKCGRLLAQGRAGRVYLVRARVGPGNILNHSPRARAGRVGRNQRGGPRGALKIDAPHTSGVYFTLLRIGGFARAPSMKCKGSVRASSTLSPTYTHLDTVFTLLPPFKTSGP